MEEMLLVNMYLQQLAERTREFRITNDCSSRESLRQWLKKENESPNNQIPQPNYAR